MVSGPDLGSGGGRDGCHRGAGNRRGAVGVVRGHRARSPGVLARVVECEPGPHTQARATAVQPGTLEVLAGAGVADRVLAESVHLGFARTFDAHLRQVGETSFAGAGCPWEFQCSLPQWRTERILADRLVELGGAVERGVTVVSVRQRDDGVLAGLERADGSSETVEASWVIGAGGAHSVTRESMAETLAGTTYPGTSLVADGVVTCGLPRDGSALIASPEGYMLLVPLPGERWLTFLGDLDEGEARAGGRRRGWRGSRDDRAAGPAGDPHGGGGLGIPVPDAPPAGPPAG
jgi:6-methylpretetramide 4-monooxygenase / 4-hydroxy-6-methylpretetramide 12a-monooxygenase